MDPLLVVIGVLGILVGLVGIVVPILPGSIVVWLATAGTLLAHRADAAAWMLVVVLAALSLGGSLATVVLPARTGMAGGAARSSFALAGIGAVLGFFLLPVLGFVVGALVGLFLGERLRFGATDPAVRSTGRVLRSYGIGVLVDLAAAITMVVIWVIAVLVRT